ncbi:hypothetical protein [Mesorhizobium abyssinicae]|uniref:hypothetical protein n=1 Tax=Mesorhizobium abyssinicae TaxID=1209958 RepID=UPI002A23DD39|nr:hypothetical protein [Mesorhizobium abyssinicae]
MRRAFAAPPGHRRCGCIELASNKCRYLIAAVIFSAGSQFDGAGLLQAMQNKFARFKQPKRIFVVAELPRNSMGMVQKNILRQRFIDTFET